MPMTEILASLSLLAGIMAVMLFAFSLFVEKNKRRSRNFLIWAVLFLAAAFAAAENAMWREGIYLFYITILRPSFPIVSYFAIWFAFVIWIFETRRERKLWVLFLVLLIILSLAALACPDCIRF